MSIHGLETNGTGRCPDCRVCSPKVLDRILMLSVTAWMTVLLPQVRWGERKAFYLDTKTLHVGMTVQEVEALMGNYGQHDHLLSADSDSGGRAIRSQPLG